MTNEQLLNNKMFFDTLDVPYAIGGSTLLGLYRDGKSIEGDHEFDVFMKVEDIEKSKLKLHADSILESKSNHGLIQFELDGKVTVCPIVEYGGIEYTNPSGKYYFVFQKDILTPYKELKFLNKKWPTVADPDLFFTHYYGNNWKTPTKAWHWTLSPMIQQAEHINNLVKEEYE